MPHKKEEKDVHCDDSQSSGRRGKSILALELHIQNINICEFIDEPSGCTDEKVLLPMLFTRNNLFISTSALLFNILKIIGIRVSSLRSICLG